jgi:hypothetical protein
MQKGRLQEKGGRKRGGTGSLGTIPFIIGDIVRVKIS